MGSRLDLKTLRMKHRQFFIVIYPETDADQNRYHCGGGLDLALSEAGMEEVRKLARRFRKNPLKVKKILAGPELRAIQMADFLHDEMKGKIQLSREFSDQILGALEGKPWGTNESSEISIVAPPQGEDGQNFSLRVRNGLESLLKEEDLVLLVAHPRVAKLLLQWLGLEKETLKRGVVYGLDLPVDQGVAHLREV